MIQYQHEDVSQLLILPYKFPGFNELISAATFQQRTGRNKAYSPYTEIKEQWMQFVSVQCRKCGCLPFKQGPIAFKFDWYEENRRRDPDNFTGGGRKIILDGLVDANIIGNDGWKWVGRFDGDDWYVDKENPRVEITMYHCER